MSEVFKRRAFVYADGKLQVQAEDDQRTCEQWVRETLNKGHEDWSVLSRGYLQEDRIQFFTGEDYRSDPSITASEVQELRDVHEALYGSPAHLKVCNGVVSGVADTVWEPILVFDATSGGWIPV